MEHRRTTKSSGAAKAAEFGRPPEARQTVYPYREQWMQTVAKEYFSPFACRR
jgi:hypothetical protein